MGVTIYDIANSADVSIATVSRVLNGSSSVAVKTKAKVLESARILGYVPNPSARSLAQKKVNVVSAIVPVMTTYFFMEVLRGVQDILSGSDLDLLIFSSDRLANIDDQIQRALHPGRSGGALLFSVPVNQQRIDMLGRSDIPVVLVDSEHQNFDSISINNEHGGHLAVTHLLERGCRKIGLIMGHEKSVPASKRMVGYKTALRDNNIPVDDRIIIECADERTDGFTERDGYVAMNELLDRGIDLDAIFVTSDIQALGAMHAAKDRGIAIPQDLAVVGFDDIQVSSHIGLTTIRQPMFEMGRQAANRLLTRIEANEMVPLTTQTVFVPKLIERESTQVRVGVENIHV